MATVSWKQSRGCQRIPKGSTSTSQLNTSLQHQVHHHWTETGNAERRKDCKMMLGDWLGRGFQATTKEATGFLSGKLPALTFHWEASDGLLLMLHLPQNQ